jgi:hypothetical protein
MDISRPVEQFVERHGESATLIEYTQTGTDRYGDPEFSESSTSIQMVFNTPDPSTEQVAAGATELIDAIMYTPSTVKDPDDTTNAPSIVRDLTGVEYHVETAVNTGNGVYRVEASKA